MVEKYLITKEKKIKKNKLKKLSFPKQMRIKKYQKIKFKFYKNLFWINIKIHKNNLLYPRIKILINKKNIKYSFLRNKFKRIIRENFRINQIYIKNIDYLIIIKKNILNLSIKKISRKMKNLWINKKHHIDNNKFL